jgi:hypothetical protein
MGQEMSLHVLYWRFARFARNIVIPTTKEQDDEQRHGQ